MPTEKQLPAHQWQILGRGTGHPGSKCKSSQPRCWSSHPHRTLQPLHPPALAPCLPEGRGPSPVSRVHLLTRLHFHFRQSRQTSLLSLVSFRVGSEKQDRDALSLVESGLWDFWETAQGPFLSESVSS